jgi:hypothetical protein
VRAGKANSLQYDANTHALSNFLSNMAAAVCEDLYSSSSDDEEILLSFYFCDVGEDVR